MQLVSNDEALQGMKSYADGKKLCEKYSSLYSSMIKLSPELDTGQKVIMHMPSTPSAKGRVDNALQDLDLITDIGLGNDIVDHLLDPDSDSTKSGDSRSKNTSSKTRGDTMIPKGGTLCEIKEHQSRDSQTFV